MNGEALLVDKENLRRKWKIKYMSMSFIFYESNNLILYIFYVQHKLNHQIIIIKADFI